MRLLLRLVLLMFTVQTTLSLAEPVQPFYIEEDITTVTSSPWLEIVVESQHPSGTPVSFKVKNISDEPLSITPKCPPVLLRDEPGQLYNTDTKYLKIKPHWSSIEIAAGETVEVCVWDGLTTFRTSEGLYRHPMPSGLYTFILKGEVRNASGETLEHGGGLLAKSFEITQPTGVDLGAEAALSAGTSVVTPDGVLTLTNRGMSFIHQEDGGSLVEARFSTWVGGVAGEIKLSRGESDDSGASAEVGGYRVELKAVDAHRSGSVARIVVSEISTTD